MSDLWDVDASIKSDKFPHLLETFVLEIVNGIEIILYSLLLLIIYADDAVFGIENFLSPPFASGI